MIHKITPKQWDAMLAVHCTAPFRLIQVRAFASSPFEEGVILSPSLHLTCELMRSLIQAAAPYMRDAAKKEMEASGSAMQRCIINVSSTSGTHGNPGQANYSTVVWGRPSLVAGAWFPAILHAAGGAWPPRCNARPGKLAHTLHLMYSSS